MRKILRGIFTSFFVMALVAAFFFSGTDSVSSPTVLEANASGLVAPATIVVNENNKINASAAFSVELGSGRALFNQDAQKRLPIASLTKLMTALVVLENYDLGQQVAISKNAMAQEGDQGDLKLEQRLSVKNLLYISLIESSNRAAYALTEVIGTDNFIAFMNAEALALGLQDTHFADATGLSANSYSTAQDIAKLSSYLFDRYLVFREIIGLKEFNAYLSDGTFHHKLTNTNQLLGYKSIVGGKTGWTNEARGCFMVVQQTARGYTIHVILGAEDRFLEMKKLIKMTTPIYE